ncbi:carboxypeptidase-like regulatory domain-containing protein [Maribellus sp. CM-23]|uniref:carboxypeptidase-like regulatory domain-containing protein n=1 Tax=Maribellus sp. CM-23 TaxID=2781026 RepID=UPI001F4271FA|nr:carboxypeptidase-like regulatory domain-containing protein [Maribellus sp. CM-23]MCE4564568.1 carboxypeptidase-like regulatory domain-containing protein [Maribellus sp. CM-23]
MKKGERHIGFDDFRRYRTNEMTLAERNAFEKELQKDPFMADALEGMEQLSPEEISQHVQELSARIPTPKKSRKIRFIAAAASILILISMGILWLQINQENPVPELTQTKKMELPPEVQKKGDMSLITDTDTTFTINEIEIEPELDEPEITETDIISIVSKPEKAARVMAPIERKEPKMLAEAFDKEKNQPVEMLTGRVAGVTVQRKDSPKIRGVAGHVATDDNIRIRGYATVASPAKGKTLRGKVISGTDKLPLPGAALTEKGTANGTLTDIDGNFVLPLKDSLSTVTVSFIGMVSKEISPADSLNATIELDEDMLALDEVVVVGYGTQKQQNLTGSVTEVSPAPQSQKLAAEPVSGHKAYREYLNREAILPPSYPEDKVVIKLHINFNRNGVIQSIENLNQADETLFAKAKQIIIDGPAWNPELVNGEKVDSSVKLRIVFRKEK